MRRRIVPVLLAALLAGCAQRQSVQVTVKNPAGFHRSGEMVEVPVDEVFGRLQLADTAQIVIYNEKAEEVPYQLTYDEKIVFPVEVDSCGVSRYLLQEGEPATVNTVVFGRQYPQRMDDIAWENDKSGYRLYGQPLLDTGAQLYGYDIFTKSVPDLVLEDRYALELDSLSWVRINALRAAGKQAEADNLLRTISYHVDHGTGMDVYDVGPTLGAGVAALMDKAGQLIYPKAYQTYEILDNGPLRFTLKLTFAPQPVNADSSVVESRIIQLDKGALLNKTTVCYDYLNEKTAIAAGIVIHQQHPDGAVYDEAQGFLAYADSTNNARAGHGVIYVGMAFPHPLAAAQVAMFERPVAGAVGHVLGISDYLPGDAYTYYWGSGWSKAGIRDMEAWTEAVRQTAAQVRAPLEIAVR